MNDGFKTNSGSQNQCDSVNELKEYKDNLEKLYDNGSFSMVSNDNRTKNAIVTSVMLEKSKSINMFCGEMSIFRERFYCHINSERGEEMAKYAKETIEDALNDFIRRDEVCMNVYIENYSPDIMKDMLPSCKKGIRDGKIKIYKVNQNQILKRCVDHISIADCGKMTRMETDRESHNANCCFNLNPQLAQVAIDIIKDIERASSYIPSSSVV